MKKKTKLTDLTIDEGTLCMKGKNPEARVLLFKHDISKEKPMKTEGGKEYPAAAFAYVPDAEKPSTWKLRLWEEDGETAAQIGRAIAALGAGFRGNKVEIPADDLPKVKAKVRAAWKRVNPDTKEVPEVLKSDSFFSKVKDFLGLNKNMDQPAMTVEENLAVREARDDWWKLTCAFEQSIMSILQDETAEQSTMLTESCMQFINRAKQIAPYIQDMYKAEGAFTAIEAICEDVSKAGKQISAANMDRLKAAMKVLHELMGMDMEEYEAMYGDKKPMKEPMKEPMKPKPDMQMKKSGIDDKNINKGVDSKMDYQEIIKSLDENQVNVIQAEIEKAVKEAIAKAQSSDTEIKKQLEDLSKQNVDLAKALEVEKDMRITKEFEDKAKTYANIPGVEGVELGKLLKNLSQSAPEQFDSVIKVLDAANGSLGENNVLLKELGGSHVPESDVLAKVDAKAAEIQKADTKISKEAAIAKVYSENPQLYNEYLAEQRSR